MVHGIERWRTGTEGGNAVDLVTETRTAAVDQWARARQQRGAGQHGRQRERERRTRIARCQTQAQRVEAVDVRRGVIHSAVIRYGVRATVRQGDKRVPAGVGESRANTTQAVSWYAVFQRSSRFYSEIFVIARDAAYCDQVYRRVRRGDGTKRYQQDRKKTVPTHDSGFLLSSKLQSVRVVQCD